MKGAKLYTTLFPCNECTKAIIQKGITEIIYKSDKYATSDAVVAAKRMLDSAKIKYRQYTPIGKDITISL
jgi:dCMP deaminase